jgi:hypothetical protein
MSNGAMLIIERGSVLGRRPYADALNHIIALMNTLEG